MPLLLLLLSGLIAHADPDRDDVGRAQIPAAQCQTAYGQTACGYDCTAAYGVVHCATWPGGACAAYWGHVTCGPEAPPNWRAWWTPKVKAQCMSAYGKTACGWGCASGFGEVACSSTPNGTCVAYYGKVTCSQP